MTNGAGIKNRINRAKGVTCNTKTIAQYVVRKYLGEIFKDFR